jgi:hypothetical protein
MGFAGSSADSWSYIHSLIQPTVLPLSICYRCPVSHIKLAQHIVPQISPRPGASQGTIQVISLKEVFDLVCPGDLVICRFTAPLISLCLKLIISGEKATVKGREIGEDLVNLVRGAMVDSKYPKDFHSVLNEYCYPKIAFFKEQGEELKAESLLDKVEAIRTCFDTFGLECSTVEQFCDRIESLFSEDGSQVVLSTVHRAKGDEANRVFILGSNFLPFLTKADQDWQRQQEWNLTYVALTRAKQDLYFVPLNKKDTPATEFLDHPLGGLRLPKEGELNSSSEEEPSDLESSEPQLVPASYSAAEEQAEIDAYIAKELAAVLIQCQTYQEILDSIEPFPEHKADAWKLLSREDRARIHALKTASQQQSFSAA